MCGSDPSFVDARYLTPDGNRTCEVRVLQGYGWHDPKEPYRPETTASKATRQTRRRFGGRQPLCGVGVTSWMEPTSRPVACRERIAVSRPEPGPLTKTSTLRMPCSWARRAAASAAICAANGVDLRDPLKPT